MKVRELIEILNKCPPDALVMYDLRPTIENEAYIWPTEIEGYACPVDDVLQGYGTIKGFVYLCEDLKE